ncbi:condensation domain-containing protein [Staphylococcus succinus]|uniref:condensation domain-containing protein n=1 Tax=Staphylococcus succinus TaxID=61015 RepID=UPI002DB5EED9|nr:condensation domain-containing protein [Staphylococcus succinus]MEB8210533.1 condensation domain-containing protein [Staphylococcus succinus]
MNTHPLSIAQTKFLKNEIINENSSINNIAGLLKLGTKFNYDQINQALNQLVFNHDSHRIQITIKNEEHSQYIKDYEETAYPFLDFYQDQVNFDTWLNEQANINIFAYDENLYKFYILKMPNGHLGLFTIQNHIIADGWSMALSINYFITYLTNGDIEDISNLSFINNIKDEEKYLESKKFEKDELYWRNKLKHDKFQTKFEKLHLEHPSCKRHTIKLDPILTERINYFCLNNEVSVSNLFASIMFALIDKKIVNKINKLGLLIHNRINKNDKFTTGNYTNPLPLILDSNRDLLLNEYIKKVKRESFNVLKHRRYPIDNLVTELNINGNILDCLISFQTASYSPAFIENEFSERKLEIDAIGIPLIIQIFSKNNEEGYLLHYDYQDEVFSSEEINELHENILNMLNEFAENPNQSLDKIHFV